MLSDWAFGAIEASVVIYGWKDALQVEYKDSRRHPLKFYNFISLFEPTLTAILSNHIDFTKSWSVWVHEVKGTTYKLEGYLCESLYSIFTTLCPAIINLIINACYVVQKRPIRM